MNPAPDARHSLALQRFLALFLFAGGFIFGSATLVAVDQVFKGQKQAIGMLLGVGLSAWFLAWLGTVLWSGRSIPRWFIGLFFLAIIGTPVAIALMTATWLKCLVAIVSVIPTALAGRSIWQNYPVTVRRPATTDSLAAGEADDHRALSLNPD